MKYLEFENDDKMPALGLGTWKSGKGEVYQIIRQAIELGYRHFDCAEIYANEAEIGSALKDAMYAGDVKREDLWITSKLWNSDHRKEDVVAGFHKTLSNLKLDYLDLYLMHWPIALKKGVGFPVSPNEFESLQNVPLEVTWLEMEKIANLGYVRHLGVSNFNISKLQDLINKVEIKPEMNQIEMHTFLPQHKLVSYCQSQQMHLTAYSPLGSGDRPASRKSDDEPTLFAHPTILKIAESKDVTPAQILLSWQINRGMAVIPKSANASRLKENLEAATIKLFDQDMDEIAQINQQYRYINGALWTMPGSGYTQQDLWEF